MYEHENPHEGWPIEPLCCSFHYPSFHYPHIWPDPNSDGWVDAWNGWYATKEDALEADVPKRPWIISYGSGIVSLDEFAPAVVPEQNRYSFVPKENWEDRDGIS